MTISTGMRHKRRSSRFFWETVSKEQLLNDYEAQGLTIQEIGQRYDVSFHTITDAMIRFGIPINRDASRMRRDSRWARLSRLSKEELEQLYCREQLTAKAIAHKYGVGPTSVFRQLRKYNIPRRSSKNGHGWTWKGRKKHGEYVQILLSQDDPMYPMANKRGYVPEHRLVMARHLGRPLLKTEVVHHRPDIAKDNNNIEMLYLMPNPSTHSKLSPCSKCELKREIRLLRWQIKEQSEQIRNLTAKIMGVGS